MRKVFDVVGKVLVMTGKVIFGWSKVSWTCYKEFCLDVSSVIIAYDQLQRDERKLKTEFPLKIIVRLSPTMPCMVTITVFSLSWKVHWTVSLEVFSFLKPLGSNGLTVSSFSVSRYRWNQHDIFPDSLWKKIIVCKIKRCRP